MPTLGTSSARAAAAVSPVAAAQSSLLVVRDWLPAGVVALALPAPLAAQPADEAVVQVADLALAATLREAAAGLAARIGAARTRTGRFFVATAAPENLPELYGAMRRAAAQPLPRRHVEAAWARASRDRSFRDGSPEDRHARLFAARLGLLPSAEPAIPQLAAESGPPSAAQEDSALAALFARASRAPDEAWPRRAWVVVSDRDRPGLPRRVGGPAEPRAQPAPPPRGVRDARDAVLMAANVDLPAEPPPLVSVQETAEIVTTWVGLAYQLPPGTTLREAEFLRTVLELHAERRLAGDVYGFSAEVGPRGRLLLQFSAAPDTVRSVKAGIAEALATASAEGAGSDLAGLLRAARSRRSQRLASPQDVARTAAEALLRGAAPGQVLAFLRSRPVPSAERLAAIARAARLVVRVELGVP